MKTDALQSKISDDQEARLDLQLERWRQKLVGVDRRQRLINFTHTKVGSMELDAAMGLETLFDSITGRKSHLRPGVTGETVRPTTRKAAPILVSNKDEDALAKTLKSLDGAAKRVFLERGISVLHAGLGMLKWTDPADKKVMESPLILVPVELVRDGIGLFTDQSALIRSAS